MTEIELAKFELEELKKLKLELTNAESLCRKLEEDVKSSTYRLYRAKDRVIDRIWKLKDKIVKIATQP